MKNTKYYPCNCCDNFKCNLQKCEFGYDAKKAMEKNACKSMTKSDFLKILQAKEIIKKIWPLYKLGKIDMLLFDKCIEEVEVEKMQKHFRKKFNIQEIQNAR